MADYARAWSTTNLLTRQGRSFSGHERHCAFLNTREAPFADISSVAGWDLPEDGRSLAVVDWDHDGDLDVWLTNRTSPRVRFFRNDYPGNHHFLECRLEGRHCNRDAVGARVEIYVDDPRYSKRIKTVRAGDGFLGQSTKTVHFGLGTVTRIDRLVVHWPGGASESYGDLKVDHFYHIVQGDGRARSWTPPERRLDWQPGRIASATSTESVRIVLTGRVPMPDVAYEDQQSNSRRFTNLLGRPYVLNLWASWCRPCLEELQNWKRREAELRSAGLEVIALSIDGYGDEQNSSRKDAEQMMRRLQLPFTMGFADVDLVHALDVLQQALLDRKRPLPVPVSLLVDRKGHLAVVYKGSLDVDQLVADMSLLRLGPNELRSAAVPFSGRWFSAPAIADPLQIAGAMLDRGLEEAAERYAQQLREFYVHGVAGGLMNTETKKQKLAELAAFHGRVLIDQNRLALASNELMRAVALQPDDRPSRVQLGQLLIRQGKVAQGIEHLLKALELDQNDADSHYNVAIALTGLRRHREAIDHYLEVLKQRPAWPPAANNLAWILSTHPDRSLRDGDTAVRLARQTCERVHYRDPRGLDTLACAQAEAGDFESAIDSIEKAIQLARSQGKQALIPNLEDRRRLFISRSPYRDPQLSDSAP